MIRPLAVSLGDPAGVGPELIAEAWIRREPEGVAPFLVAGGAGVLREAAARRGIELPVERIDDPFQAADVFARALPVLPAAADASYAPGEPGEDGARLALASLELAAILAA